MELLQLRYFQKVAKMESMTKAAKSLYIAQPSLSKTISRLESQIGMSLFNRNGKRIYLNEFGERFLVHVDKALSELDDGIREIHDMSDQKNRSVSVGSATAKRLPNLIVSYMTENPETRLRFLQVTQHSELLRQLQHGEIDISISSLPLRAKDIVCKELIRERIYLVAPPNHPLSKRETVSLQEIGREPLIYFSTECGMREIINKACEYAEFVPNITCECTTLEVTCGLVEAGLGSAFLPEYLMDMEYTKNLSRIPLSDANMERIMWMSWNKGRYMSNAARDFREFVFKYFSEKEMDIVASTSTGA